MLSMDMILLGAVLAFMGMGLTVPMLYFKFIRS